MKTTLGKKIIVMFFIPFLLVFVLLSLLLFGMISRFIDSWIQLEQLSLTEINALDLSSKIDSVRISVLSAVEVLEEVSRGEETERSKADAVVKSLLANDFIYNSYLIYEPNAFDGRDEDFTHDYSGAPSGRFMRSYLRDGSGGYKIAHDMDEEWIDDIITAPWYVIPRDSGNLYIEIDSDLENLWDYGDDELSPYTMSVVVPIFKDGKVIGCVGADVALEDNMTLSVGVDDNKYESSVAIFFPNGKIFYSPNMGYAEESIETLDFAHKDLIRGAFENVSSLVLANEFCVFSEQRSFVIFEPVFIKNYDNKNLFMYVSTPRSMLIDRLIPIAAMLFATVLMVVVVLLFLLAYVVRKVSKPVNELTLAAEAISHGNFETEIDYSHTEKNDEIGKLSRSLHRMVERFRVNALKAEQTQQEIFVKFKINEFTSLNRSMEETFTGLAAMLCEHVSVFKATFVYISAGKPIAFSHFRIGDQSKSIGPYDFEEHREVENTLGEKRIAFLNANTIKAQGIAFAEPQTNSVCIIPLKKDALLGYIILENSGMTAISESIESILMYVSDILSEWLFLTEWERNDNDEPLTVIEPVVPSKPEIIVLLRNIENLDIDIALEAVGGLHDIYEASVKLTARLLPDTINRLEKYYSGAELKSFTTEIHGIKSVLRNIGANLLGGKAASLEKAAASEDGEFLGEEFPPFIKLLKEFSNELNTAVDTGGEQKTEGDKNSLLAVFDEIKEAVASYDATLAKELLSPLCGYSYDAEADELLEKVIFALEEFNCEGALININKLEELLK